MSGSSRLRRLLLASLALMAILLLGCDGGGDGEDEDAPTEGTATVETTTATSDATVAAEQSPEPGGLASEASGIDTCTLLTADEVEAAIGTAVGEGTSDIANSCDWGSGDPDDISVTVSLISLPASALDVCASALADDDQYEESDLGEGVFASYNPALGGLADIVACTADGQLQVIVNGGLDDEPNEEQLRGAAEQLAEIALERM